MITFPPAKINLGLRILNKRSDGYHTLETLFVPIALCDVLEVTPAPKEKKDQLLVREIPLEGDPAQNTVLRTLDLLRKLVPEIPPQRIELVKYIPSGAGLGGGSSDAAHLARLLNQRYRLGLSTAELSSLLSQVGADCPFFLYERPMLGSGIGTVLTPLYPHPTCASYTLALVKPPLAISTAEAYRCVRPDETLAGEVAAAVQQPVSTWRGQLINDFEQALFPRFPELAAIKEQLYTLGAHYAAMSGSGSTFFGLFPEGDLSKKALQEAFPSDYFTWIGSACDNLCSSDSVLQ